MEQRAPEKTRCRAPVVTGRPSFDGGLACGGVELARALAQERRAVGRDELEKLRGRGVSLKGRDQSVKSQRVGGFRVTLGKHAGAIGPALAHRVKGSYVGWRDEPLLRRLRHRAAARAARRRE